MPKPKWQRNNAGGYSLMIWYEGDPIHYSNGKVAYPGFQGWRGYADVFKSAKGERWIARWLVKDGPSRWQQGSAETLRGAMRLARFMVGVHHGH